MHRGHDEQQHHRHLYHDDEVVEVGGLFDPDHEQSRDHENDEDSRKIKDRDRM